MYHNIRLPPHCLTDDINEGMHDFFYMGEIVAK